jgi:choline dehydrogenase-like flavoprotein
VQRTCDDVQIANTGRPLCDLLDIDDDALNDLLLAHCSDSQHGAGSCCMGLHDANGGRSVVDPNCCVLSLEGLRVIDASIMPVGLQTNTNLTAIMIGEKMADRLRAEFRGGGFPAAQP